MKENISSPRGDHWAYKEWKGTLAEKFEERFIEAGAALEHARWTRWQKYLHSKCRDVEHETDMPMCSCNPRKEAFRNGNMVVLHNRDLIIPGELVERWERQIATPYEQLSESEKESDRREVREYLPLFRTAEAEIRQDERRRIAEWATNSKELSARARSQVLSFLTSSKDEK